MVSVLMQLIMLMQTFSKFIQTTSAQPFGVDKSEANALAHISILEAWDFK